MTATTHTYRAWYRYWVDPTVTWRTVELDVLGGLLTMDENWSPFVQADLKIATPDEATLALLDPRRQDTLRDAVRLEIAETGGTAYTADWLTVRELKPSLDGTTTLTLASRDVLLQESVWTGPTDDYPTSLTGSFINIVEYAVFIANLPLDERGVDQPFPVYWDAVNRIPNAAPFNGADQWTRTGWRGIVNCANPNPQINEGGTGDRYTLMQCTGPASGTANAVLALHPWTNTAGRLEGVKVEERKEYSLGVETMVHTLVGTGRTIRARMIARFYDQFGNANWGDRRGDYVTLPQGLTAATGAYKRPTLSVTAPRGAQTMGVILELDGIRNGDFYRVKKAMLNDGLRIEPQWFHGSSASDANYVYEFSGNAFESPSTRRALTTPDRDMLIWETGVSSWEFLTGPLRVTGKRVWADGDGVTYLSPTRENIVGAVSILEGVNLTGGSTSIDRGSDEFAHNLLLRFKWNTRDGPQTAYSLQASSTPVSGKTLVVDIDGYPDSNIGYNMLQALRSRGRASEATAVSKYDVRPGMALALKLPDTPIQTGRVSSVRFDFDTDEMTVRGRDMETA